MPDFPIDPQRLAAAGELSAEERRPLLEHLNRSVGFVRHNGIRMVALERGRAVFEVEVGEIHMNGAGVLHGGVHAALMDSAMGIAATTLGSHVATIQMGVHYLGSVGGGLLTCEGRVVHRTRRIATAEARVHDQQGRLVAIGTGSFRVFEPREPDPPEASPSPERSPSA